MRSVLCSLLLGGASLIRADELTPLHPDWSRGDRVERYFYRTFSKQRLGLLAVDTAVAQVLQEPRDWDRGSASFALRYSSGFGRRLVRNSLELGLEVALDEDTRFRPSLERNLGRRVRHAVRQAFFTSCGHNDRFSYARLGSTVGVEILSARWNPRPRSAWDITQGVGWGYTGHLENSLFTEFAPDMKALGRRFHRSLRLSFSRKPGQVGRAGD